MSFDEVREMMTSMNIARAVVHQGVNVLFALSTLQGDIVEA